MRYKDIGTKHKEEALYAKLVKTFDKALKTKELVERTKYWFVVAEAGLQVQLFTLARDFVISDVTAEYLVPRYIQYYNDHTLCCVQFKYKAMPLIVVWHNLAEHRFYSEVYFVNMAQVSEENIVWVPEVVQVIYNHIIANHNHTNAADPEMQMLADEFVTKYWVEDYHADEVVPFVAHPVVYENGRPRFAQIIEVHIVAKELARKWTWVAKVTSEGPKIKFEEQYMRGGQACNNVITRCKQEVYKNNPGKYVVFHVEQLPRRKDDLKVKGQSFLDAVFISWLNPWRTANETFTAPTNSRNTSDDGNNMSDADYTHQVLHHAAPVYNAHVPNYTVVITVFALEYPRSAPDRCLIALVCDNDNQLAIELRTEKGDVSFEAKAQLVEDMKALVREKLQSDAVTFIEVTRKYKFDKLRAWAHWWLDAAMARAHLFANWARGFLARHSFEETNKRKADQELANDGDVKRAKHNNN
jgi:hypothetical protein